MKKIILTIISTCLLFFFASNIMAATEQEKQAAIDAGLAYLATTMTVSGDEGYWPHGNDGTLAATASAALAFIEEGYLPGDLTYGDVVDKALTYIFNRAQADPSGYGIYFNPGNYNRSVYTTGIVAPVIFALGNALGPDTTVDKGTYPTLSYRTLMQDVVYWFCWGQNNDGGWRYYPNYGISDNSTAQWGGLPLLYAQTWGLTIADPSNLGWDVIANLNNYINYIQCSDGGSGYTSPCDSLRNVAKTGGLLVELAAIGAPDTDARVLAALSFINSRWNTSPSGTWYGNLLHPYAMWAVYKGLELYGKIEHFGPAPDERFFIGTGMPSAPGGIPIGQEDWSPTVTSQAGDWYSHYCDVLVGSQNLDGSWSGYSYWETPLATGWFINILNAVPVVNQAPTADPNGPYTGDEGSPVSFDGTGSSDPDEEDTITYDWDFGDGNSGTGPNPTHTYADNGVYTVCLTVTDNQGAADTACTTAEINNVAPTITSLTGPVDPVQICDSFSMNASFTDPGTADTHTAVWEWESGDTSGTSTGTVSETNGSGTVSDELAFCDEAGVYTVTLTVTDDDGGVASMIYQYVVIYDPSAGFVTGGGWIDSPTGAYPADSTLTGKATFGFVSKYKNNATTPTGNTEFQFHAGDLNFHSDSYQWLTVAGPKAMYKGTGTINGEGNYGFILFAIDEKLTPSTDVDLFRIKIWDINDGDTIVYDNQIGDDDDGDPATELQGGNIMIHKK